MLTLFSALIALSAQAQPPAGNYQLAPKIIYDSSCEPYKAMLVKRVAAGMARFQDCLNFAFVREDIAKRMAMVLSGSYAISVSCVEPPNSRWCAAGGWGQIILSPTKMLAPSGICYPDLEGFFVHEAGHVANLQMSMNHNEQGDTGAADEVYSLQNYCMRPARMWIPRAYRTQDVVEREQLSCMRAYQEFTPETDIDPFWDMWRPKLQAGQDVCPAPETAPQITRPKPAKKLHWWQKLFRRPR